MNTDELKKQSVSLVGPVSLEMLAPYDEIMRDELCVQKPKRRFTVRYKGLPQTEFKDYFVKFSYSNKRIFLIEQISFAPTRYVHYIVKANELPMIDKSEAELVFLGEYHF